MSKSYLNLDQCHDPVEEFADQSYWVDCINFIFQHQQDSLRETIEIQPFEDQREYLLGTDNSGQRYIHFPQFCGADVRVYRQAPVKYPKIEIKPDPFNSKRKVYFVTSANCFSGSEVSHSDRVHDN